jgi:tryptophan synthase beta chain
MESAHAIAYAMKLAPTLKSDRIIVINLSGRGDKDAGIIAESTGGADHETH